MWSLPAVTVMDRDAPSSRFVSAQAGSPSAVIIEKYVQAVRQREMHLGKPSQEADRRDRSVLET